MVGQCIVSTIVPSGCRRFSCDLQSKQGGECLFAKYILRRTDAELGTLEGEIRLNYLFCGENGNRICGNTNGTAIDDIQPE